MSESDGTDRIDTILSHLGRGRHLQDFPGTTSEKLGLIRTAGARRLIAWNKARARYELTFTGWRRITRRRGLGLAPLVIGATVGAAIGAVALAVLLPSADVSHGSVEPYAMASVSHPAEANVGLGTPAPAHAPATSALPPAPPAQHAPASTASPNTDIVPVKLTAPPAADEPSSEAAPHIAKQTHARRRHHHKTSRARTRRMWASAYRDERYARSSRILR
jgi:hypothetical protein